MMNCGARAFYGDARVAHAAHTSALRGGKRGLRAATPASKAAKRLLPGRFVTSAPVEYGDSVKRSSSTTYRPVQYAGAGSGHIGARQE